MKPTLSDRLKKVDFKIIIFLAILLYYFVYWGNVDNFVAGIDHSSTLFADFVEFYYPAGQAIIHHMPLPNSFYYSTFAAILFVPFSMFSLKIATLLWGIFQILCITFLFFTYLSVLPEKPIWGYVFTFVFFTNTAVINNLKWGQVSVPIFLGSFAAFLLYEKKHRVLSAIILASTIAFKFFPILFLFYFLIKKDWKYLALCGLLTITFLLIIPSTLMGLSSTIQSQLSISGNAGTMLNLLAMDNIDSQYFASVILRMLHQPISSPLAAILIYAGYLVIPLILLLAFLVSKKNTENSSFWVWGLLSTTVSFWIPSAWPHYYVYLPLLQVLALSSIQSLAPQWKRLVMTIWMLSVVLSNILLVQIVQNWFRYIGIGALFWSNLFILIVSALALTHDWNRAKAG